MRRWMGAVEWSLEYDRPFIRDKLVHALLPDNLSCYGELQGVQLLGKKLFLERCLMELDTMDEAKNRALYLASLEEKRSELQKLFVRVHHTLDKSKTILDRSQEMNLDWWGT